MSGRKNESKKKKINLEKEKKDKKIWMKKQKKKAVSMNRWMRNLI